MPKKPSKGGRLCLAKLAKRLRHRRFISPGRSVEYLECSSLAKKYQLSLAGKQRHLDRDSAIRHSELLRVCLWPVMMPNALVQLQARYHHCGEAASEKCLSAATIVRPLAGDQGMNAVLSRM